MYDNLKPSYEEIHNACKDIALRIEGLDLGLKCVAGVARGGLLPATILSHLMKLPLLLIDYSSKEGQGDDKNHNNVLPEIKPEDSAVLIVDDICDSGKTLSEIITYFTNQRVSAYTAVLYFKQHDKQPVHPTFVWKNIPHDSGWVIFPYERNEYLTPDLDGPRRHLQSLVRS